MARTPMKNLNLSTLSIKILLKCNEKALSMHDVTQLYKTYKKDERDKAIEELIDNAYIESIKMPKLNAKRTPTYYLITTKGKNWTKEYLDFFSHK